MDTCAVGEPPEGKCFFFILFHYLIIDHGHFHTYFCIYLLPSGLSFGGGECKDPSHSLFSPFIYSYLDSPFYSFTIISSGCTLLFKQ